MKTRGEGGRKKKKRNRLHKPGKNNGGHRKNRSPELGSTRRRGRREQRWEHKVKGQEERGERS